jgi:uncharacterized protein YbjQ (UPF0145 family)
MQISTSRALDGDRAHFPIGQIRATTGWRSAEREVSDADREFAARALIREAEEYGADALIEVAFAVEECHDCDIQGVKLRRLTATGTAVRLAIAA